jgi:spermidine/putrescine-binding protein
MQEIRRISGLSRFGVVITAALLVFTACSQAAAPGATGTAAAPPSTATGATPVAPSTGAATPAPSCPPQTPAAPAAAGTKHVSIVNKDMSLDEIKAAITAEGGLTVGNWTYTATDTLVAQFQKYVKEAYGVDITLDYKGSQTPSEYLTKLNAAKQSGSTTPYDVLAIEENYWAEAKADGLVDDYLPSDLVPNQKLLLPGFVHAPTTLAFQGASFIALLYNKTRAPWITKFMDLADPRLKQRITIPPPGDISAGGFLLAVADELGKDYKDPNQMKEVVDWVVTNIGPNVLKYSVDQAEMSSLIDSGTADAESYWNGQVRLEYFGGHTDIAQVSPKALYPINGYLWIPKKAPHPVLAQIFINWRISPEVQFPNDWCLAHGPWAELSEGFLGPDYVSHIPDWFQADYYKNYLTIDQIKSSLKVLDWNAYNASSKVFQDYYAQKLGR